MPTCSYCEGKSFSCCEVSLSNSSRYAECVRLGRSRCDVLGDELQAVEKKVLHLRKQKKIWFKKMIRIVRRSIDSVEELERVEREEVEVEQR
ncbi:hypothetical protein CKAH01_13804 [Colletotrichum kahawae]|uniref:Uncharacterized protein n=1 Tax=Colletotrichum kahawae TaxID=34407 RepID=A0AAD9YNI1_COLKA|nr:hypothetical protein CKAH01_13804 [Colletotrichum kahawae]